MGRVTAGGALILALLGGAAASATVPTPESVLGFSPGEDRRLVDWSEALAYLRALDRASPRVRVDEVGRTTLGRPFVVVTSSSEANLGRIEEIRRDSARLADPRGLGETEADALIGRAKVVVAMAFSIHSTEVGGTLAALRLLHRLASSDDAWTREVLDRTVLLVIPSQNPDGTDVVSEWYERQLGTPFEGSAPPVLYHPYAGHDNNRDWYAFALRETQLTVRHVHQAWHPHIVHDVHQMGPRGARLFVPPYADPWEPNVDPALVAATNALGTHVAARLTSEGGSGILTGALFDAWSPSRAYPHTHAGVRLLSETASARLATPIEVRAEDLSGEGGFDPRRASAGHPRPWAGGTWRLADVVGTQLSASLAILDHAASQRELWLRTALGVRRRAVARSQPDAFVIANRQDPGALRRLLEILQTGEVEVGRARRSFQAGGRSYEAGSLVVSMAQPASAFAKTVLERQRYPDLRECAQGPLRRPYDVTAHTLPLLLGIEAEAVAEPFEAELEAVTGAAPAAGGIEGMGARFALGHTATDLVALARLLAAGVETHWALEAFVDEGRRFEAGALLVPSRARARLDPIVRELGLVARAVSCTPPSLRVVRPRVGVYRSWVPSSDEGWTRFVLEREMLLPFRSLHDREVRAGRLRDRFDAIVLPDQSAGTIRSGHTPDSMPPEYTGGLGVEGARALEEFVREGGTLVALDSSSLYAIEALRLPVRPAPDATEAAGLFCPGSVLEAAIESDGPLAHGLPRALPVWFEGSPVLETDAAHVIARYGSGTPLLSGWLSGGERLAGRAALVEVALGRGRVVLFGFRPQYRAQSRVTYPALLNALYLSAAQR